MAKDLTLADNAAEPTSAALAVADEPEYTGYMVLGNKQKIDELAQEMDESGIMFDSVLNPSVGGKTFTITSSDGEKIDVRDYSGIILHAHEQNTYYEKDYDSSSHVPPDCYSVDTVTGIGTPGGLCADCPKNVFASAKNGKGKACKNKFRLFVLFPGDYLPTLAYIPSTNLRVFREYRAFVTKQGRVPRGVETNISIDPKSTGSYAKFVFKTVRDLNPAERAVIDPLAERIKAYSLKMQNVSEDPEIMEHVDPETGEVIRPLTATDKAAFDAVLTEEDQYIYPDALQPTVSE